nr:DMT family transporter [Candidatus Njordarchaeota archaeon]
MIGEIAAISAAFCWALSAVLYKKVLGKVGYMTTNLVRAAFAALFLLLIVPVSLSLYQSPALTSNELAVLVFGALTNLFIGDTFYFMGLRKIGVSRAQPISGSYPLFSMLLAAIILSETLTFAILIGTPLIVAGIAMVSLTNNEKKNGAPAGLSPFRGVVASIGASIFWSVGLTAYKVALSSGQIDLISANLMRTVAILPFLILSVVATRESKQLRKITRADVSALAAAGILALGIGGTLLFISQTLIENSRAIPLSSISPLFSLVLASHYSGERVTTKIVIGTILIVTGVILVTFLVQQ